MRKVFFNLTIVLGAVLLSTTSFSQSSFNVDNQTDCDVNVRLTTYSGACNNCGATTGATSGTATANSNTQITAGGGPGGEWGCIEISSTGGNSLDGPCCSTSNSIVCNGEDIFVEWVDCSNATVKKVP